MKLINKILIPTLIFGFTTLITVASFQYNINNTRITKAEESNENINFNIPTQDEGDGVTRINQDGLFNDGSGNTYRKMYDLKINTTFENNYFRIRATNYSKDYINPTGQLVTNTNEAFFIYEITTFNEFWTEETNITLNWKVPQDNMYLSIGEIYLTEKNISNFLNNYSYTNYDFIYWTVYEMIQNDNQKIKLRDSEINIEVTEEEDTITRTIEDIHLDKAKVYYLYGIIELYGNRTSTPHEIRVSNINIVGRVITPGPTYEVINIWGLMLNVLTMPFSFMSQAFDLTIFKGTPYAFNLSSILLSIVAIATLLFIIKLILGFFKK